MPQPTSSPSSVLTVADVAARVRRRPLAAAVPVVLGTVCAVGYLVVTPPAYTATAAVRVEPVVTANYDAVNLANVINMATELEVAQSSSVADRAARTLRTTRNDVLRATGVSSPQDTQILKISYTAATPDVAARGANVVATAYASFRYDATHRDAEALLTSLGPQIATARAALNAKGGYSQALADSYRQMLATRQTLQDLRSVQGASQVTVAGLPSTPSSPKALMALPAGIAGGVIAGLSLAVLWPQRRRRRPAAVAAGEAHPEGTQPAASPPGDRAIELPAEPALRHGPAPFTPPPMAPDLDEWTFDDDLHGERAFPDPMHAPEPAAADPDPAWPAPAPPPRPAGPVPVAEDVLPGRKRLIPRPARLDRPGRSG